MKKDGFRLYNILLPLLILILLFFLTIYVFILPYLKKNIDENETEKIKMLVQIEIQLLDSLNTKVMNNEITREQAEETALEIIRNQRYGDDFSFYFWVIDLEPVLIMHPHRKELIGRYVGDYTDPQGNRLFQNMVNIAEMQGEGYLEYQWEFPEDNETVRQKRSFIKLYEPWGWILGTGFYFEKLSENIRDLFLVIYFISGLAMMIAVVIAVYIILKRIELNKSNIFYVKSFKETEKKYEELIGQMNEGFVLVDKFYRIELINKKFLKITGMSKKDLIGKSFRNIVHEESIELYDSNIARRRLGENKIYEIYLKRKDGAKTAVLVSPKGMFDENNEFAGSCAVFTDINALNITQKKLETSLSERDSLIKEIHHRVKNNLQIIISLLNMEKIKYDSEDLNNIISDSEARIYSMALVHEIIFESKNIDSIDFQEYLQKLTDNIQAIDMRNRISIVFSSSLQEEKISVQKATAAGLTITEILMRLLKLIINTESEKKTEILITAYSENMIFVIDFSMKITKGGKKNILLKESSDLNLISILTTQLHGDINLEINESGAYDEVIFRFQFPLNK